MNYCILLMKDDIYECLDNAYYYNKNDAIWFLIGVLLGTVSIIIETKEYYEH